jgi:AcrR family transcriptional regulator
MSRKNSNTRQTILETTWKLLESRTGEIVRMSDIAKAAGISRQALYLHFPARADLLIATARHLDEVFRIDDRLAASRSATSGLERLDAFIEAWGNYIPEVYGVVRAFMAMEATDEAAATAWSDRKQAVRHGCAAAIKALKADDQLDPALSPVRATDLLWTLLSVPNWENLRLTCGWAQKAYITEMKRLARAAVVRKSDG